MYPHIVLLSCLLKSSSKVWRSTGGDVGVGIGGYATTSRDRYGIVVGV